MEASSYPAHHNRSQTRHAFFADADEPNHGHFAPTPVMCGTCADAGAAIRGPLCAFAHRAAARRFARGGAGQLARCTRPWRHMAGAYRRCGYRAVQRAGARHHLAAVAAAWPGGRWRSGGAVAAQCFVSTGAECAGGAAPGIPLHLFAPPDRTGVTGAGRCARTAWRAGLPGHLPPPIQRSRGMARPRQRSGTAARLAATCFCLLAAGWARRRCRHHLARSAHGRASAKGGAGRGRFCAAACRWLVGLPVGRGGG